MSTPLRLLLIEDSEDDAMLLLRELRRGGYELTHDRVDTPEAMTAALDGQKWDIILADYVMPRFSGLDALKLLREKKLDVPLIIVSGKIGEDAAVGAIKAGATDHINKNSLARLVPAVERALREAEMMRERRQAEELLRESSTLSHALNNINLALNSTLDFGDLLERVCPLASEALGAESSGFVLRDDGSWVIKHLTGILEERAAHLAGLPLPEEEAMALVQGMVPGQPLTASDTPLSDTNRKLTEKYGVKSYLVAPMMIKNRLSGALFFAHHTRSTPFQEAQVDFAMNLASLMSLVVENIQVYEATRVIADTLQESLLTVPEQIEGVDFGLLYRSASEAALVGGDFYDIFELESDRVVVMIGDVAGKGLKAATLASLVRNTIKAHCYEGLSPCAIIDRTNDVVRRISEDPGQFVTVFFGILDRASAELAYCSAGHPQAMILRTGSKVSLLKTESPAIGVLHDLVFSEARETLRSGDKLVLYTDGATEARSKSTLFGERRLVKALRDAADLPTRDLPEALYREISAFTSGRLADDLAILAASLRP